MHLHDLPEDVLREIFCKLPIRSVLAGRAVCKLWNTCLSEHSFIAKYDATSSKETWIIYESASQLHEPYYMFNTADPTNHQHIIKGIPIKLPERERWILLQCSEGLLCFRYFDMTKLIIYNPVTRRSKEINCPEELRLWKFICSKDTREWKVMMIGNYDSEMHIFSSRTGTWALRHKAPPNLLQWTDMRFVWNYCRCSRTPTPFCNFAITGSFFYEFDKDKWTKLEGNLLEDSDKHVGLFHCMGHGIIKMTSSYSDRVVTVYKYHSDVKRWQQVSQTILSSFDTSPYYYFSDGLDNVFVSPNFHSGAIIYNYNVAQDQWRRYRNCDISHVSCTTFSLIQP